MRFLITLGDFEDDQGKLLEMSWEGEKLHLRERMTYRPPTHLTVNTKGFTGGCIADGCLWVCSFASVHQIGLSEMEVIKTIHYPWFNDLHHVTWHDGQLLVCNTGLDRVEVLKPDGSYVGAYSLVTPLQELDRQDQASDPDEYFGSQDPGLPFHQRKVRDLVHPNHIVAVGEQLLVTRFLDRRVDDLRSWLTLLPDLPGYPHDGIVWQDQFWVTCTNGLILAFAISPSGQVLAEPTQELNLFESTGHTGWCRGLAVTDEYLLVGLTAIRRMPRERWCARPFNKTESSILLLERGSGQLVACRRLDDFGGHPKVFSILPWPNGVPQ